MRQAQPPQNRWVRFIVALAAIFPAVAQAADLVHLHAAVELIHYYEDTRHYSHGKTSEFFDFNEYLMSYEKPGRLTGDRLEGIRSVMAANRVEAKDVADYVKDLISDLERGGFRTALDLRREGREESDLYILISTLLEGETYRTIDTVTPLKDRQVNLLAKKFPEPLNSVVLIRQQTAIQNLSQNNLMNAVYVAGPTALFSAAAATAAVVSPNVSGLIIGGTMAAVTATVSCGALLAYKLRPTNYADPSRFSPRKSSRKPILAAG